MSPTDPIWTTTVSIVITIRTSMWIQFYQQFVTCAWPKFGFDVISWILQVDTCCFKFFWYVRNSSWWTRNIMKYRPKLLYKNGSISIAWPLNLWKDITSIYLWWPRIIVSNQCSVRSSCYNWCRRIYHPCILYQLYYACVPPNISQRSIREITHCPRRMLLCNLRSQITRTFSQSWMWIRQCLLNNQIENP